MDETPIFKLTKLTIAENDRSEYIKQAENNMHHSIPAEQGTLLIASGHDDAHGEDNYEVELFRNQGALDVHLAADHADDFAQTINKIAKAKTEINLYPELITTKSHKSLDSFADNFVMRLVKVVVKDGQNEKFAHAVKKEIATTMAVEPGMEIMMSGTNKANSNEWYFFEVYANDQAYDAHVKAPHYEEYITATNDIIESRDTKDLARDALEIQGPIVLDEE